jgi:hypothetical protein
MMMKKFLILIFVSIFFIGCINETQEDKDRKAVASQQSQYAASQPVPAFNWSLERHLVSQLYQIRNMKAATHSVWRSDRGLIEGDCPSIGFGIPYDTSLTNPLQRDHGTNGAVSIEQAEPNGIFASKNTAATWVMCAGTGGIIEPVYVETKVTVYPYPVKVDYSTNRATKAGESTVKLKTSK